MYTHSVHSNALSESTQSIFFWLITRHQAISTAANFHHVLERGFMDQRVINVSQPIRINYFTWKHCVYWKVRYRLIRQNKVILVKDSLGNVYTLFSFIWYNQSKWNGDILHKTRIYFEFFCLVVYNMKGIRIVFLKSLLKSMQSIHAIKIEFIIFISQKSTCNQPKIITPILAMTGKCKFSAPC